MKHSRASCEVVSELSGGLIFRGSAPLDEVLAVGSRAALVHDISYPMLLCYTACRIAYRGPGRVGFLGNTNPGGRG